MNVITRTLPTADELRRAWRESPRWRGVTRVLLDTSRGSG